MSKQLCVLCAAACMLVPTVAVLGAPQNGVEANGTVSLPSAPATPVGSDRETKPYDSTRSSAIRDSHKAETETLPRIEERLLGLPAAPLSPTAQIEAAASSSDDGYLNQLDPRSNDVTKVIGALAIVVGLILMLRVFLRKSGSGILTSGGKPSGVVEILAKYPVGRAQHVVLMKVARRVLLIHQNGSSMTTLSELSEPNEVAGLLSRLEAGSTERDAERFRRTLTQYMAEHESAQEKPMRQRRITMPPAETEIVDLTRSRRSLSGMLGRRSGG